MGWKRDRDGSRHFILRTGVTYSSIFLLELGFHIDTLTSLNNWIVTDGHSSYTIHTMNKDVVKLGERIK